MLSKNGTETTKRTKAGGPPWPSSESFPALPPTGAAFIPADGRYENLLSFQKTRIVYDRTVRFCARFLNRRDRTCDQMVQAARSGEQNIIICLTHQTNYLLDQFRRLEQDFSKEGDLRERMTRARAKQSGAPAPGA